MEEREDELTDRLNRFLADAGLPEREYAVQKDGYFRWNEAAKVRVDAEEMERLAALAGTREGDERIGILREACRLYQGELLPQQSAELWVAVENLRFKKLYEETVRQLCGYLNDRREYEEVCRICAAAAAVYPCEGWQEYEMDGLMALGRYEEAYQLYLSTTKMYSDKLGLPPSEAMMKRLERMSGKLINEESNISKVQTLIREREPVGAYFCSYAGFVDVYRFVCRQVERSGQSVFLMLCSLRLENGAAYGREEAGRCLEKAIGMTLRRCDSFTRYNDSQFLILLVGTRNENCDVIYRRIRQNFQSRIRDPLCRVDCEVSTVVQTAMEWPELHFKKGGACW